jgi:hypothetical protein
MMDTVLNLGINDEVVERIIAITGNAKFAYGMSKHCMGKHCMSIHFISKLLIIVIVFIHTDD